MRKPLIILFPYGDLIAKILCAHWPQCWGPRIIRKYYKDRKGCVWQIKIGIKNEVLIYKPPKENKVAESQPSKQQEPLTQEDFDYEIPQNPPTEALLNTLIKEHKRRKKKINCMTC